MCNAQTERLPIEAQGMLPRTSALKHERLVTLIKRDDILSVFHALGRVLYNKRIRTLQHLWISMKSETCAAMRFDSNNVSDKSFNLPGDSQAFPAVVIAGQFQKDRMFSADPSMLCRELMSCDPEAVILSSGMSAELIYRSYMKIFPNSYVMMQSRMRPWLLVMFDASILIKLFRAHIEDPCQTNASFLHPQAQAFRWSQTIPELAGVYSCQGVLLPPIRHARPCANGPSSRDLGLVGSCELLQKY